MFQKHQHIHLPLLLSLSSTANSSSNSTLQSYHYFFTDRQGIILDILFQSIIYFAGYLTFQFVSSYIQQQSKQIAYYVYTPYFFLDRRKQLIHYSSHDKSELLRCMSPRNDNDNLKHKRLLSSTTKLKNGNSIGKSPIISHNNVTESTKLYNQLQVIPKLLITATNQQEITISVPSSPKDLPTKKLLTTSNNNNCLSGNNIIPLSTRTISYDQLKIEVPLKAGSCKQNENCYNDNNVVYKYSNESTLWPPQKDAYIDDVVQRTLNSNLVNLWTQQEILMENYMKNFPGQPSKRRYRSYHQSKSDYARTNTQLQTFPTVDNDNLPVPYSNNNNMNHHNRHKLYLLAREVLLYYEKEYGSHRGTPEAERIRFLRKAISNFT